jgi:hypothetical protein
MFLGLSLWRTRIYKSNIKRCLKIENQTAKIVATILGVLGIALILAGPAFHLVESTPGEPLNFTMGWFVVDDPEHPYVEHAGGGVGIRDLMWLYLNEGVAIVLMSNASGYDELAVVDAVTNVVFSLLARQ